MSQLPSPPRLAPFEVAELDDEQRALYAAITGGPRAQGPQAFALVDDAGHLEGPFNAMLLCPALGTALQELGAAVRYGTGLTARSREIAILTVGHHLGSGFEVRAHEATGRAAGLTDDELAALHVGRPEFADRQESTVAEVTAVLLAERDLGDDRYAAAEAVLGRHGLFEVLTVVGYYSTLALQMRVFRVPGDR